MTAHILKLPRTKDGRDFLRYCIHVAGGWDFPDGSSAADFDWDAAIIEAEIEAEKYERWCIANDGDG